MEVISDLFSCPTILHFSHKMAGKPEKGKRTRISLFSKSWPLYPKENYPKGFVGSHFLGSNWVRLQRRLRNQGWEV